MLSNYRMFVDFGTIAARFSSDARASVAVFVALCAFTLVGVAGVCIDYAVWIGQRAKLQSAADSAALASVSEGPVHAWNSRKLVAIAKEFATRNMAAAGDTAGSQSVQVEVSKKSRSVTVRLQVKGQTYFTSQLLTAEPPLIEVSARASLHGEASICMLALNPEASRALSLRGASSILGKNCAVLSNSESSSGLTADLLSKLASAMTCTSGGYRGLPLAFNPIPVSDCPATPDPLAHRTLQDTGACTHTDLVIDGEYRLLSPGTYCGSTQVINAASVQLRPGVYTFSGGILSIESASKLHGENVSLQFKGPQAGFRFAQDVTISLSAPSQGASAGMLLHADSQNSDSRSFHILSADAERMIGVIYLPTGQIIIGGDINLDGICDLLNGIIPDSCKANLGQTSHWTAIIANTVIATTGANIVLNTDFAASDIPAPDGIGGEVVLDR